MFTDKTNRAIKRVDNDKAGKYDNDIPERRPVLTWLFDEWFGVKLLVDQIQSDRRLARYAQVKV